jgi:uncharacterized protein YceK
MGMLKKIFISIIITIVSGCAAYQSKTVNNVTTAITDQGIQYKGAENSDRFCKFPRLLRKHFVLLCVHCCYSKADQDC